MDVGKNYNVGLDENAYTDVDETLDEDMDENMNMDENMEVDENIDNEDDMEEDEGSKRRPCSTPAVPRATTLGSYPGDWKAVLVRAKRRWQRYILLCHRNPFPECELHLTEARKLLLKVISERRVEGEILSGEFFDLSQTPSYFMTYLIYIAREHTRDMDIVVSAGSIYDK